ncbi:MAG: zinc ribbon domain-containing protein [Acidobacteriota bacterium]|nr:zinc ribbon domain-containing protein [Acidobacteriota bacterium]
MYCSTCGKPVTVGLSYCNHCGARLTGSKSNGAAPAELFPESLVWAIVSVFVVGLGGTIGLMAVMKDAGTFNPGMILALTFLSFAVMLAVEGVLIWLLLGRRKSEKVSAKQEATAQVEGAATRELGAAEGRALPEPVASVTDHTTRTLKPVYRERKAD